MPLPPPRWGEVPCLGARDSTPPSQTQLPAGGLQLGAQIARKVWLLLARPPVTSHGDTLAAAQAGVQVHGGLHPWGCLPLLEAPLFTHRCPRRPTPTPPTYRGLSTGSELILPPGSSLQPPLLPAQSSGLPPRGTEEPASVRSFIHSSNLRMFIEHLPVPGTGLSLGDTGEEVTRTGIKPVRPSPAPPPNGTADRPPPHPYPEKPPPMGTGGPANYNTAAAPGGGGSAPHAGSTTEPGGTSPLEPSPLGSSQRPPSTLCLSFPRCHLQG